MLVYDSLLWPDSTGRLLPWLASSYESSPDGLQHTFKIREGVRWHDGQSLTAEDVAFSFDYALEHQPERKGGIAPYVIFGPRHVAKTQVVSPGSVLITLDKPAANFIPEVAGRFPIVAKHIWSSIENPMRGGEDQAKWIGTGPYRLKSYGGSSTGGYLFEANDEFFLGKPYVSRVEMPPVGDELTAIKAGDIDAGGLGVRPTSADVLQSFRRDRSFGFITGPVDFLTALHFNLAKGGPLGDTRFRQAVARGINRVDMVQRLLGGMGVPGNPGFLSPDNPSYSNAIEQYRYDLAAAKRLLDEAGYRTGANGIRVDSGGKPLSFVVKGLADSQSAFEYLVQAFKALGIDVKFQPIQQLFTELHDYELALIIYGGIAGDPDLMRSVFSSRVENKFFFGAMGYKNSQFDDLADRQLVTLNPGERVGLVKQMQQIVANDLPILHLYYPRPFLLFRRSVFDQFAWNPASLGPFNKQIFVTGAGTGGTKIRPTK